MTARDTGARDDPREALLRRRCRYRRGGDMHYTWPRSKETLETSVEESGGTRWAGYT